MKLACAGVTLFLAATLAGGNDFRFCVLGDRTGDAQPGIYESVWRDVKSFHPDFAINSGDTIQGGNDATAEAEWKALRPLWSVPMFFVPGNHDIWSAASRRIYEKETGHPAYYSFNFQNAHFTVLDNSQTEGLDDGQMEFLARDLEQNKDRDPKFVFFHKPFWLIPVKFRSGAFPFHQLIKKFGVRYVVSGHGHQFVCASQDGVTYLEAGSSGGKLKGQGFEQGWFFGHIQVRVVGADAVATVSEAAPPAGQGRIFKLLP